MKWQALILIAVIFVSVTLERLNVFTTHGADNSGKPAIRLASLSPAPSSTPSNFSFEKAALVAPIETKGPTRKWDVLDPQINAKSVLIESVDDGVPLLHIGIATKWPAASLIKLITAIVVLENAGEDKKVPVSAAAVATEGESGNLRSGEVYTSRDLLKIMLLASSNDATAAFEEYFDGRDAFLKLARETLQSIGMTDTVLLDASGLNDADTTTANDMLKLVKYILANHPEIFELTRLKDFLAQPLNDTVTKTLTNINAVSTLPNFLGGKTGTSPAAKENLVALFSFHGRRVVEVILGSSNRTKETETILGWLEEAYQF
jgi:D-alanyl-D-alanine carboxypeptidase